MDVKDLAKMLGRSVDLIEKLTILAASMSVQIQSLEERVAALERERTKLRLKPYYRGMDYKMNYDFGKHYEIKPFNCYADDGDVAGGTFTTITKQIHIKAMDHFEDKLVEEIIKIASENNVTDVVLLDKLKIVRALQKATPVKWNGNNCPVCRSVLLSSSNYCHRCGQKITVGIEVNNLD